MAGPVADEPASTLDDLIICYLSKRVHRGDLAAKTARAYLYVFQDFAAFYGDRPVRGINGDHVDDWMRSNGRKGAITRNTDLGRVKPFLTWMARRGHLAADPRPDLRNLKVPRKLPPYVHGAEVAALLRACTNLRDRLIILLMIQLALRCCEISTMKLEDISFTERYVKVTGKAGHQRLLPIDDQTWSAFGHYMGENPASSGPVIRALHYARRPIGAVNISQLVVQLMYAAKIKHRPHDGMSAHALRHTACVDMLRAGSHVRDVQAALGHLSLATTQSYMPMVIQGLRRAMGGRYYGEDPAGLRRVGEPLQLTLPGIDGPDCQIKTLLDGLGGAAGDYPQDTWPMEVPRQWYARR